MPNEGNEPVTSVVEGDRGTAETRERRRSVQLILLMRGLRSMAYGLLAVILGVMLAGEGLSLAAIGVLITVSLVGDMVGTYLIGLVADTWGRRRTLALLALLSAALGALAAGLPDLLMRVGLPLASGIRLLFGVYAVLGLIVAGLSLRLFPPVEAPGRPPVEAKRLRRRLAPPLHRSRSIVWKLTSLFSIDALAGGLVVQSLVALFFHLRFGVPLPTLSALFFGANLLSALSFLAAVPLARRFGLLGTMVFTHLPSNVLLALVAFAPTFPIAATLLLLRQALSQMDVPTRQAYTMTLVDPQERTAAASVTSLARSLGSATSPVFSGLLLQGPLLVVGLPFILAGTLKAAYDLTLWFVFRRVPLPEEEDRSRQTAVHTSPPPHPSSHEAEAPPEHGRRGNQ
jgi:MFS family permease